MMDKKRKEVTRCLLKWFIKYGRKFPWRRTKNSYRIFIAESLLQKTNVEKVYPAYLIIIKKYPNIDDLAEADDLFTKLMGDVVEPRREFIQQNALNVENLDF